MNNLLIAEGGSITNPLLPKNLGQNPDSVVFLQKVFPAAITIILIVGSVFFFFSLLTGAIKWITSGGDKQALESARGRITSALVGIVILFSAFAIVKLIETFFGVSILTIDIGSLIIK